MKLTSADKNFLASLQFTDWKAVYDAVIRQDTIRVLLYEGFVERRRPTTTGIITEYRRTQKSKEVFV